jgi:outer membrane murein-binding lipoprotein Lpp
MNERRKNQKVSRSECNPQASGGTLSRRTVLSGIVAVTSILAGCSNQSSTTNQNQTQSQTRTITPTETPTSGSLDALQSNLEAAGIDVLSLSFTDDGDRVELSYESADPNSQDTVTNEIGTITGEFYNSIDNGLTVDRLTAIIVGPDGTDQVRWYAEQEWYTQLQNGEISADELTFRVINTVEEE